MKKILWIAPYPYELAKGEKGYGRHPGPWITELAKEISKFTQLTIVNWSKKVDNIEKFRTENIDYIFVQSPKVRYDLLLLFKVRISKMTGYLEKIKSGFDLIHVHGTEHQYEAVAQRLGRPYIISIQGLINLCLKYHTNKFSTSYANWVLSSLYERFGIKKSKYFFCRTIVDTGFVRTLNPKAKIFTNWEIIREEFFTDLFCCKKRNLLFIGGTNYFKGLRETLRCLSLLKKRGYKIRLRICGSGNKDEIERVLRTEQLEIVTEDINFVGYQSVQQLAKIFKDSFCLIHPSYMENSPNSICEAQVAGLPVVASDVGGVGSLITEGLTGLLVNRYDHTGLADQVCRLLNDEELYRRISEKSRSVGRRRHNREKIVRDTLKVYLDLIGD